MPNRPTASTTLEDMALSRALVDRFFTTGDSLPLSFNLDGEPVRGLPADWSPSRTCRTVDANAFETVWEAKCPTSGLRVRIELTQYRDFPVCEWTAWFTNDGPAPTPILGDILAFDGLFDGPNPVVNHYNGDFDDPQGYEPFETPCPPGEGLQLAPVGGKPSRRTFPYFRLLFDGFSHTVAVGWPGQWQASFAGIEGGVHLKVGQEFTHLRLLPGEQIRTPRIAVLSGAGDRTRAINLWRRWYLAHLLPRPDNAPLRAQLAVCGTGDGEEFTAATEANQLEFIDKYRAHGIDFDVWWIDAGWYSCRNPQGENRWWRVGTWQPDPVRFPNGFRAVSDAVAKAGADLLLWFEPERVQPGTELDVEHPEWLLSLEGKEDKLLNWGLAECRAWLTERTTQIIQEGAVKVYRQDHNFQPLLYWRANDAPDRQGLTENLYVQGYLRFWDDLAARNPGIWFDSCAGGGARNDLETMRRSVPLHYSDHGYGDHPVKLAFHRTLFEWIPYFKESTVSWDKSGPCRYDPEVDSFSFHCAMAPMLFCTIDIKRDDYDFALMRKMVGVWRSVGQMIVQGDYYALTPYHRSDKEWVALQFDCPEWGTGFLQGIRLPQCEKPTLTVRPQAILPEALYALHNPETGETKRLLGSDLLRDGFTFELPARAGAVWRYRVVQSA